MLLVKLTPVFAYYCSFMLCWVKAEKAHIWQIAIMEFLDFALESFIAAARNVVFIVATADPPTAAVRLVVLVRILDRLARWIDDLGFISDVHYTLFDHALAYVSFHLTQGVDCSFFSLRDPFSLYRWRMGKVIGLGDKRVHEGKQEVEGGFFNHERRLPSIAVDFCLMFG